MGDKIILLISGGLDSTVLFYKLFNEGKEIFPVFVNYGQHTAKKEYESILKILPLDFTNKVKVIDLKSVYSDSESVLIKEKNLWIDKISERDMYVPYRNLVIFSVSVAYAQSMNITKIYAAFINTYYAKEVDASIKFLNSVNSLMQDIGGVEIVLPFKDYSKFDVLSLGIELGAPVGKTYSCQINSNTPCGACPNCVERLGAFKLYDERIKSDKLHK